MDFCQPCLTLWLGRSERSQLIMNSSGHILIGHPIGHTFPFYQVPITCQDLLLKWHKLPPLNVWCFSESQWLTDDSPTRACMLSHHWHLQHHNVYQITWYKLQSLLQQGLCLPQHPMVLWDLLCAGSLCFTQYLDQRKIPSCGTCWLQTLKRPIDIMLHLFYGELKMHQFVF